MDYKFDIFKKLPDGDPYWITAVQGFVETKNRMARLALISPGEYFMYLLGDGFVAELSPNHQQWSEVT